MALQQPALFTVGEGLSSCCLPVFVSVLFGLWGVYNYVFLSLVITTVCAQKINKKSNKACLNKM